jgi:hypothetical protein
MAAGVSYTRYADPLGPGHGPRTGRPADGLGWGFGVCHEWKHKRSSGLLAGVQVSYSTSGYYFDESGGTYGPDHVTDGMERGRRSMHVITLDIPVMMVWRGLPGLRLEAGIMPRMLVLAEERWHGERSSGADPGPMDRRTRCDGYLAAMEWGVYGGALVEGRKRIGMGLHYFMGLTNLDRSPGSSASYGRQIQLAVTYRL